MLLSVSFNYNFFPLLIVVALAWLVPVTMSLIGARKVPNVIVEIIAGYLVGMLFHSQFAAGQTQILDFLALCGFLFLMFQTGLEIDVDKIVDSFPRKKITYAGFIKNPLLVGLTFFIITVALSNVVSIFLSQLVEIKNTWFFSIIMVTSSVGIILPVLKNRGETASRYGQMIVLSAAIADIFSVLLITFSVIVLKLGFRIELLLLLLLFVAFYVFYRVGNKLMHLSVFKRINFELQHAALQITMRGTMLLIILFVVLAQFIDKEAILLGAFLGGLLLSIFLHKERSLLLHKLDGMGYGFFIPIFFIMIGVHFDFSSLKEFDNSLLPVFFIILIALYLVKIVPSFLFTRLFGLKKSLSGGILLASRLSVLIAAAKIALDLEIISTGLYTIFIVMAVITGFISPVLYGMINKQYTLKSNASIIIGGGSTSVLLARRLQMHGHTAIIVDNNTARTDEIKAKGLSAVAGDGLDVKLYEKIKLKSSNHVIVLTGDEDRNVEICKILRHLGHEKIISTSKSNQIETNLKRLEIEILDVKQIMATTIENIILRPTTYHSLVESFENYSVEEIQITSHDVHGHKIEDLAFHQDGSIILLKRGNEFHVPHGDTVLRTGDLAVVIGSNPSLVDFKQKFMS